MSCDVLALRHPGWFCSDAYLKSHFSSGLLYAFNLNVDRFMTMVMKVFDLIVSDTASFFCDPLGGDRLILCFAFVSDLIQSVRNSVIVVIFKTLGSF